MPLGDLLYLVLQVDIQRRVDDHTGARQLAAILESEYMHELIQHEIGKMWCAVEQTGSRLKEVGTLRLFHSIKRFNPGDILLRYHQTKYGLETLKTSFRMEQWIKGRRIAGNTGKHGGLRQVELRRGTFAGLILETKVHSGSGVDAIRLLTIVDAVKVHFQDVALRIEAIDLRGQHDLFEIARKGGLVTHNQILD